MITYRVVPGGSGRFLKVELPRPNMSDLLTEDQKYIARSCNISDEEYVYQLVRMKQIDAESERDKWSS